MEVRLLDPGANPYLACAALLMAGFDGIKKAKIAAENVRPPGRRHRLLFAHPAIINPDGKEAEKTGGEIPGRPVQIIYSGFNNAKTQKVRVLFAYE